MTVLKNNILVLLLLLFIICIGSLARLYKIEELPPGLTIDEVSIGYNAFTLASVSRDQDGNLLPISHFRSLDDYKLPLYIYVVSLSQKIFGNDIFTIRFPSVLFSILTIVVTFLVAKKMFDNPIGILSAFLIAISPWNVFHSHLGFETNAGLFFSITSILFLLMSLRKSIFFIVSVLLLILTMYTHHVFWIFLPPLFVAFLIIHKNHFFKKQAKILITGLLVVVIAMLPFAFEKNYGNKVRFNQSIFSEKRISQIMSRAEGKCKVLKPICIQAQAGIEIMGQITSQYVRAYSLSTFYLPSGFDLVGVAPNRGLFYFFEFPLLVLGIVILLKRKDKNTLFLISWLLIYPLPSALSDNISATRMYPLLPLPQIIEALGLLSLFNKGFFLKIGLITIIVFIFGRFLSDYWFIYPFLYSRYTDYGSVAIVNYINANMDKNFYVEEPLFNKLYLFYFYKVLPHDVKPFSKDEKGVLVTSHKNIFLVERGYLPGSNKQNVLISFPEDVPKNYKKIGEITLKDNSRYAVLSSPERYYKQ